MSRKNLTLVTSLFDIGRADIDAGFSRGFDHYLECFSKLLAIDLPMVIFCDDAVEEFVWKHRNPINTRVVRKTLTDLRNFPFYNQTQTIRKNQEWINRSGWIVGSPQAALELYNPLVMSKQFFLNDASIFNPFDTKYFAWIDAGLSNTVNLPAYFGEQFVQKLTKRMNKMLYVAFPYDGNVEVHGFEKSAMNRYAHADTAYVVRGGFFGGTRDSIALINDAYYAMLQNTLNDGLMGTEESVFTLLSYNMPDKINLQMIENNGLVYKFFQDVEDEQLAPEERGDGSLAIYALTYNLPRQFKLWVESFKNRYPTQFKDCIKYVLNNSDDDTVAAEYAELFKEHNFTELKYNNIGINDGRFECAKHFNESTHEFMVFFEDDMLLHNDSNQKSKLGFCTSYNDIFDIGIDIIKNENLDYLKLSFDEFYGNNLENWGWYNLPLDQKNILFPTNDKRTAISHLGSLRGVPYAVGEFHYCNWPIIFTKSGSRKIFMETQYASKFEQTWMSMVCSKQRLGQITAGTILGSVINHNRVYHYKAGTRKENKHN